MWITCQTQPPSVLSDNNEMGSSGIIYNLLNIPLFKVVIIFTLKKFFFLLNQRPFRKLFQIFKISYSFSRNCVFFLSNLWSTSFYLFYDKLLLSAGGRSYTFKLRLWSLYYTMHSLLKKGVNREINDWKEVKGINFFNICSKHKLFLRMYPTTQKNCEKSFQNSFTYK